MKARERRLVLVGAGHAQLPLLHRLAHAHPAAWDVVLVEPAERLVYSGMVPGVIAGLYEADACRIALAPIVARTAVRWLRRRAFALDAAARELHLDDGSRLGFDLASIDAGSAVAAQAIPGAAAHAWPLRPIDAFVDALPARLRALGGAPCVVIGGGAAGFEVAAALAHRGACVRLVAGPPGLLAGYPPRVRRLAEAALRRLAIGLTVAGVEGVDPDAVVLGSGERMPAAGVVLATGAAAPAWLREAGVPGVALDAAGFIRTGPTLQSVSHPAVFAAGDIATRTDAPHPKSGVHAVRAGPALAQNVFAAMAGRPPQPFAPPARTLNLLSCGAPRAIVAWGAVGVEGAWAWRWKDAIDRRWVQRQRAGGAP